ncbi:S-adenosyl-L-methionine-dependent methyltransferase [Exidia glandulosa HHB12029]|uniref:S-adenosyl-L-methionine-dependent methyltransferase n=1 Tax=Exidia glandulosa HHB12029 TaxID=1314781 RepID=A0A165J442_EXIGL|nr:S-adenosyl-L-methionine-dependent methyltransferase [Exidia glandulosa HHB12029]
MERVHAGHPDWPGHSPLDRLSKILGKLDDALAGSSTTEAAFTHLREARALVDGLDDCLDAYSSPCPPLVEELLAAAQTTDWDALHKSGKTKGLLLAEMSAGTYEASVLRMLAQLHGSKRVLEVGMFVGGTALALAMLPTVEKVVSLEYEEYLLEFATPYFEHAGVREKMDVRIGDGLDGLKQLAEEGQQFDMVFVDANKDAYPAYFRSVLDLRLLAPGGIICLDNSLYKVRQSNLSGRMLTRIQGCIYAPHPVLEEDAQTMREVGKLAVEDARVETVMLPVRDGLTISRLK